MPAIISSESQRVEFLALPDRLSDLERANNNWPCVPQKNLQSCPELEKSIDLAALLDKKVFSFVVNHLRSIEADNECKEERRTHVRRIVMSLAQLNRKHKLSSPEDVPAYVFLATNILLIVDSVISREYQGGKKTATQADPSTAKWWLEPKRQLLDVLDSLQKYISKAKPETLSPVLGQCSAHLAATYMRVLQHPWNCKAPGALSAQSSKWNEWLVEHLHGLMDQSYPLAAQCADVIGCEIPTLAKTDHTHELLLTLVTELVYVHIYKAVSAISQLVKTAETLSAQPASNTTAADAGSPIYKTGKNNSNSSNKNSRLSQHRREHRSQNANMHKQVLTWAAVSNMLQLLLLLAKSTNTNCRGLVLCVLPALLSVCAVEKASLRKLGLEIVCSILLQDTSNLDEQSAATLRVFVLSHLQHNNSLLRGRALQLCIDLAPHLPPDDMVALQVAAMERLQDNCSRVRVSAIRCLEAISALQCAGLEEHTHTPTSPITSRLLQLFSVHSHSNFFAENVLQEVGRVFQAACKKCGEALFPVDPERLLHALADDHAGKLKIAQSVLSVSWTEAGTVSKRLALCLSLTERALFESLTVHLTRLLCNLAPSDPPAMGAVIVEAARGLEQLVARCKFTESAATLAAFLSCASSASPHLVADFRPAFVKLLCSIAERLTEVTAPPLSLSLTVSHIAKAATRCMGEDWPTTPLPLTIDQLRCLVSVDPSGAVLDLLYHSTYRPYARRMMFGVLESMERDISSVEHQDSIVDTHVTFVRLLGEVAHRNASLVELATRALIVTSTQADQSTHGPGSTTDKSYVHGNEEGLRHKEIVAQAVHTDLHEGYVGRFVPLLTTLAMDEGQDCHLRTACIQSLGRLASIDPTTAPTHIDNLSKVLVGTQFPSVQRACIDVLGLLGNHHPSNEAILRSLLVGAQSPCDPLRAASYAALVTLFVRDVIRFDKERLGVLARGLVDPLDSIQRHALLCFQKLARTQSLGIVLVNVIGSVHGSREERARVLGLVMQTTTKQAAKGPDVARLLLQTYFCERKAPSGREQWGAAHCLHMLAGGITDQACRALSDALAGHTFQWPEDTSTRQLLLEYLARPSGGKTSHTKEVACRLGQALATASSESELYARATEILSAAPTPHAAQAPEPGGQGLPSDTFKKPLPPTKKRTGSKAAQRTGAKTKNTGTLARGQTRKAKK